MGGNVLQVLTKVSPCRQIQASVGYYLPLCVWSVMKNWIIYQPARACVPWHLIRTLRLGVNISIQRPSLVRERESYSF